MNNIAILCLSILLVLFSCKNEKVPVAEHAKTIENNEEAVITTADSGSLHSPLLISDQGFYGIQPGMLISDIPTEKLRKGVFSNGEGAFDIYEIQSKDGQALGHFYLDPQNENKVGTILVRSRTARTIEGIGIRTTYAEIQEKLPDFEVHGSEIESQTHVFYGNLALRLDYPSNQYNIDKTAIPPKSRVLEISIR